MNPESYSDLIAGYVANTLSPEQRHAFEQELEGNAELRKKLAIHEMAQEFIPKTKKKEGQMVTSIEEPVKMPEESEGIGNWWMIGLVILAIIFIAWLMYR